MSKTGTALIIKFVMTFILAVITFTFIDGNTWGWVFTVAIVGTVLNYVIGDLFVLPKFGNVTASVGDGIMAALTAYVVDLIVLAFRTSFTSLIVFAALIAVGEYFFHQYLLKSDKVEPNKIEQQ